MLSDQKIGMLAIRAINASGCKVIKNTAPFGTEVVPMVRHILDEYESAAISGRDARIAELERELEEARKDAERYQWLCGFSSVSMPELTWGRRAGIPKNKLDAAIDAAIKEQT